MAEAPLLIRPVVGNGIKFRPIWWIHHDSWTYQEGPLLPIKYHWGHVHLFMLGFPWEQTSADAFSGQQTHTFDLKQDWGPGSTDPNQQHQYTIIGTPKLYWHIQEIWRRVYIQRWDERFNVESINLEDMDETSHVGRLGLRWDASPNDLRKGPFREGNGFSPMFIEGCRTLPIEYFLAEPRTRDGRENFVKDRAETMIEEWNEWSIYPVDYPVVSLRGTPRFPKSFIPTNWDMPAGNHVIGGPHARGPWLDSLYVFPTIEYQTVTQLDWERLPGDTSPDGDGWGKTITLPFKNPANGKYNSPFGADVGLCSPFGVYHNTYLGSKPGLSGTPLVPAAKRPKHRTREDGPSGGYDFVNEPFGLPAFDPADGEWTPDDENPNRFPVTNDPREDLSGAPMTWSNPYPERTDGRWVQQCLGGIVQVKAEVTIEHKLGGRQTIWVHNTQLIPTELFEGSDQYQG